MPRQVRLEFAGAMYHVMARGNLLCGWRPAEFFGSLGLVSERSGFRAHGYFLTSNHYHLLLETPEAALAVSLGWLQGEKLLALVGGEPQAQGRQDTSGLGL